MSRPICRVEWTEKMRGWFAFGERDYQAGFERGQEESRRSRLMFRLTIGTDDVYEFLDNPAHEAEARGWITSDVLGGRLCVRQGPSTSSYMKGLRASGYSAGCFSATRPVIR